MRDKQFNCRRYIAVYAKSDETLIAEYDLTDFDLKKFQLEFGETNPQDPMVECYPITQANIPFLSNYLDKSIDFDFTQNLYFLEAHG